MALSSFAAATRAFVAVLLHLARYYELVLQVNRDSSPETVLRPSPFAPFLDPWPFYFQVRLSEISCRVRFARRRSHQVFEKVPAGTTPKNR